MHPSGLHRTRGSRILPSTRPAPKQNSLGALRAWCKSADTASLLGPCPYHPFQCCKSRSVRPAIFCSPDQSRTHHLTTQSYDYSHLPCLDTRPLRKQKRRHLCAHLSRHPADKPLRLLRTATSLRLPLQSLPLPLRPQPSPTCTRGSAWHLRMAHLPPAHRRALCHRAAQHVHWSSVDRTIPPISKDPFQGNGCT